MLTSHELFGFMSPALADEILNHSHTENKELYRATLSAVANARKLRPVFLERQPRASRHPMMVVALSRPALEAPAQALLQGWLMKKHNALLVDFLDALGLAHKQGAIDDLPPAMEDAKLGAAIDTILTKHPREVVAVYLNAFHTMNDSGWTNLDALLKADPRLQF